jgi:hypothetical protein
MYPATSVLQSGNYKKEFNKWEGRNTAMKTWSKWKQAYYLAAYARGINGNANARVPQTNRSVEWPTWSRSQPHMM